MPPEDDQNIIETVVPTEAPQTGAMVALFLPAEAANRLAIPGGLPANELHITLAYLGEAAEIEDTQKLIHLLAQWAKFQLPIDGKVDGLARFVNIGEEGQHAVVALFDSPFLPDCRQSLAWILDADGYSPSMEHGFTPHITLSYIPANAPLPIMTVEPVEIRFDRLTLALGGQRIDFELTGAPITETTEVIRGGHQMPQYMRAYPATSNRVEELLKDPTLPVPFIGSTEGRKKDGKNLRVEDWLLDRFNTKYSVILFSHDYRGELALPVGTGQAAVGDDAKLHIDVLFDVDDPFAMKVRSKAVKGMMAASVGWEEVRQGNAVKNELVELSMVPVPLDPDALPDIQRMNFRALVDDLNTLLGDEPTATVPPVVKGADGSVTLSEEFRQALLDFAGVRGAIPPHTTPKADEGVAWDGPGEVARCASERGPLRRMHAWVDDEMDPDTKRAYKLPHHTAEGVAVWRGVAAAMTRAMQTGTNIPDADIDGVVRHLARHYQLWDKEPPERSADGTVLFRAGEPDEFPDLFGEGEIITRNDDGVMVRFAERAGATISARNMADLEEACRLIQGVIDRAKKTPPGEIPVEEEETRGQGDEEERRLLEDILSQLKI